MGQETYSKILSAWAIKDWTIEDIEGYIESYRPQILEISKDFVEGSNSLKRIKKSITRLMQNYKFDIAFAGTTNIISCEGFDFITYLNYLKIQFSEALFLDCSMFRLIVGHGVSISSEELLYRLEQISNHVCKILIEIHNGWESSSEHIQTLIEQTQCNFVIDFQNLYEINMTAKELLKLIPFERIAYFHSRNLGNIYVEHPLSVEIEKDFNNYVKFRNVFWEPKLILSTKIKNFYNEYRQIN